MFVVTSLDQRLVRRSASDVRPGVQALLKCVSGVGEDVFPLTALERGLVIILNSLASFCIDAPQAPKLVRPTVLDPGHAALSGQLRKHKSLAVSAYVLVYLHGNMLQCCRRSTSAYVEHRASPCESICCYGLLQLPCNFHM